MDDEFEPDFEEEEEEVIGFVNSFLYDNNVADNDNGVEDNDNEMVDNNGVADNDNEVEDIDNEVEDIDNEVADNDNEVEDNNEVADNDNEVEDIDNEVEDNDNEVADNDNEVADNNNEMADNDNDTNDVADTTDTNDDTNDGVVGVLSDDVMKLEKVLQEMYSDIGGLDQQKQQIKESIELPLTHPQYNKEMGIKPPDTNIADIIAEVITQNNQKRTEITKNADSIRPENQLTSLINNKKRTEITKNADLIRPENQLTSKINNNNKIPTVAENPSQHITAQYIGKPFKTVEIDKIYYDKVEKYLLTKTLPTVYGYSTNEEDFIKETRKFKMENGKLYLNKCEVIKDEAMQLQIARESHLMKSNPKRHRTKNQSVRFIEQKYFWGGIGLDVENVYNQCLVCNPIKAQLCQLWKFIEVGIVCENVIIVRDLNKKSQILTCVVLEIITPQSFTELIVPLFLKYGIPDAIRIVKSVVFDRAFVEMFINILRQDLIEVINQMKSLVNLVGDKEFFPKLPTMDVISEVRNSKCPTNEEELDRFKFTESTQTPLYVFHSSKWAVNQSVLETIDKLITDVKSKYNDWKLKLPVISSLFQMCGTNFKCNERIKMEQMDQSKARDNRTKKEADKLKITLKATNARDARDTKKKPIIIDSSTSDSESDSESNCSTKDKMALENDLYLSSSSSSSSSSDENDVIDNNNNNNKSELKFNDKSELKVTSKVGNVEMNNSNPLFETSEIEKPCSPINDSSVQPEEFQQICQFLQNNFSHSTDTISQPEEQISTKINSDTNNGKPAEHEMLDKSGEREYLIKKYDKNKECKKCVVVLIKYPRKFFIDAIDGKVTDFDKILSQQTQLTEVTENISLKRKPSIDTLSECDLKSSKKLKNSNENEENSSKFINGRHRKSSDVDNAQSSKTIDLLDGTAPSVSSRKRNISGMSNESIESKSSLKSSCENRKRLKSVHMTINIKNKEFNKPKQTKNLNLQSSTKDNVSYNETNKDNSSSSNKLSTNLINMTSLKAINLSESSNSDDSDGDNVSPIKLNLNKTNTIETRPTPRTFKCEQCSFHSNDAHLLLEHKAKHKKLICNECAMIFNSNNDLDEHKAAEHPPNTSESILYGCEKCPHFSGYKMDEIDSHLKDTHIETIGDKFKCSLCKKVFSEKTLADHLLIHRKYKCVFCVFFASKFTELERHGRQKHIEYENYFFRCAYCTEFDSPCFGSLTDHNKTCHAIQYTENGEKCCVCDIVINGSDETHNVLEHLVTHVNQEIYIYKCRFDSTRCNRLDQMTSHCYRYHGSNETKDLCEPFDTTFLFQEILKKLKNRNENAIRKIPNLNETQNAIAALFGDSFQDNYDNEDEENIIHNNDALGNALNIAFSEKNDDENEVPVLSIPNSSSSPEKFVNFYVTDNGLELIDEEQESQEF